MTDTQTFRPRPAGETSGTGQRPPQQLAAPVQSFDLASELEQLRREETYRSGDRNAKTLVKEDGLSVVLTVMRQGTRLREHSAPGPISVQTLAGRISLHALDGMVDLPIGHVATFGSGIAHDVEAVEESAFLLTIGSA